MSDQYFTSVVNQVREALAIVLKTTDSRTMFRVLLSFAGVIAERLIVAGIMTPEEVAQGFTQIANYAVNPDPTDAPPTIKYLMGGHGEAVTKDKLS